MTRADMGFGIALSITSGIAAASFQFSFYPALFIVAICMASAAYRFRSGMPVLFGVLFIFGFFYYFLYLRATRVSYEEAPQNTEVYGIVSGDVSVSGDTQYFTVDLGAPQNIPVNVVSRYIQDIRYGDVISLKGSVHMERYGPQEQPVFLFPIIHRTDKRDGTFFIRWVFDLKHALLSALRANLGANEAALAEGMTFGEQGDFSKELKDQMIRSGTIHMVALSGYNIQVIVIACALLFSTIFRRNIAFILTILAIFLFVVMVGASASVVRAAIMGFLVIVAKFTGRRYSFRNAATITASCMALQDPTILRYNIGFQLSFVSLFGITYISPLCAAFFKKVFGETMKIVQQTTATTFGAQLAVTPLLLAYFQRVSPLSILPNVLILPFIPYGMFLSCLVSLAGLAAPLAGFVLALPLSLLLKYQLSVIALFSTFSVTSFGAPGSFAVIILYYLFLFRFVRAGNEWIEKHNNKWQ